MEILDFISKEKLQRLQDLFSTATGVAACIVDTEGNHVTEDSNFLDFCIKYTRGSEIGLKRCQKCDLEGVGTYFCHAGLMDFAADIVVEGEKLGAIVGGQVLRAPQVLRALPRLRDLELSHSLPHSHRPAAVLRLRSGRRLSYHPGFLPLYRPGFRRPRESFYIQR